MIVPPAAQTRKPARVVGDSAFQGMDAQAQPERLADGYAQRIENMCVEPGGSLISRPPLLGQFTTPLPAALHTPTVYHGTNAGTPTTKLVFGAGAHLYWCLPGAATYTEITKAGGAALNVSPAALRLDRFGRWLYGFDANGDLFRTDTTSAGTVTGINPPAHAPTAKLTSMIIRDWAADASPWKADFLDGGNPANVQDNRDFAASTVGETTFTGWTVTHGTVEVLGDDAEFGAGVHYVRLDAPGDQIESSEVYTNPALDNDNGIGDTPRYAKHFRIQALCRFGDNGTPDTILAEVVGYASTDGTGPEIIPQTLEWLGATAAERNTPVLRQGVIDFSGSGVEIRSYRARFTAGSTNHEGANAPYLTNTVLAPFSLPVTFAGGSLLGVSGNLPDATQTTVPIGGMVLSYNLGAGTSYAAYSNITIPFTKRTSLVTTGLRLYVGFRATPTGPRFPSNLVTVSEAGDALTVDISTIDPADLASVQYIDLVFESDAPVSDALPGGTNGLFYLGALTEAGTLSVGVPVLWRVSFFAAETGHESDGSGAQTTTPYLTTHGVESSGSPYSLAVKPTTATAQADVTIIDAPPTGATHAIFWREGGVFSDGLARLVAFVPLNSGASGSGWRWDETSLTLRDNTPDSALRDPAAFYQVGRDKPPTGITNLVVHDGRLWLAKGNTLYASWLLADSNENALYFTLVPDPSDPAIYSKGASFTLASSFDSDTIVALVSLGGNLLVFRQQSVNIVSGTDATNFEAVPYLVSAGVGCLAPRGVCQAFGRRVWFVGAGGVMEFNLNDAQIVSKPIEPLLNARSLTITGYPKIALCAHNQEVYVFAPESAGFYNVVCYVYDSRTESWVIWAGGPLLGATGAVSVATQATGHDLYIAGGDGQLYRLADSYGSASSGGDKATPTASAQIITTRFVSRAHVAPGVSKQRPNALMFDVETLGTGTEILHWKIVNEQDFDSEKVFYVVGRSSPQLQNIGDLAGRAHEIEFYADVSDPFRIYAYTLRLSDGGVNH